MLNNLLWSNLQAISQKSFYGKAKIAYDGDIVYLKSYDTIVCSYNTATGAFKRLWSGYSPTTMIHINDFCRSFGLRGYSKKEWMSLLCEGQKPVYKISINNGFYNHVSPSLLTQEEAEKERERLEEVYQGRAYIDIIEA